MNASFSYLDYAACDYALKTDDFYYVYAIQAAEDCALDTYEPDDLTDDMELLKLQCLTFLCEASSKRMEFFSAFGFVSAR